jgi:Raf kinase inhibitor-like YbhB/YbcL family protein
MIRKVSIGIALGTCFAMSQLAIMPAASAASLKVKVASIKDGGAIPGKYAFCVPAAQGHSVPGPNISPPISWSKGPKGTQSYVAIMTDTDSPKENRDKMNKEGMTVPSTTARRTFFHWVLVDIPANVTSLKEGAESTARVPHGKPATPAAVGVRGLNMFNEVFAANEAMKGNYYGYDGPCAPWNDENVHHHHFIVYALSVKSLNMPKDFGGLAVMEAMKDKILAEGKLDTIYTQNPATGAVVPK